MPGGMDNTGASISGVGGTNNPPSDAIQVDVTVVTDGIDNAVLFVNPTTKTIGNDADFLYIEASKVLVQTKYTATALDGPTHTLIRGRGTISSKVKTNTGDLLGQIVFGGYAAAPAVLFSGGLIQAKQTTSGAFNASSIPIGIGFYSGGNTSASFTQGMFLGADHNVGIGYPDPTTSFGARLDVMAPGNQDTDIAQRWRNDSDTIDMFWIAGDGFFNIEGDSLVGFQSIDITGTYNLQQLWNSSTQWIMRYTGGTITNSIKIDNSVFEVSLVDTALNTTNTITLSNASYATIITDTASYNMSEIWTLGGGTIVWSLADISTGNGTFVTFSGDTAAQYVDFNVFDAVNNSILQIFPSEILISNPFRVQTGGITSPSAVADSFSMYSADIAAGNACFHTIAEGGQIWFMGDGFGTRSNHSINFYTNDTSIAILTQAGNFIVPKVTITEQLVFNSKTINTTAGDSATINCPAGRFRKDTSGSTFTLTNSFITANSIIQLTYASAPGITGFNMVAVAGSGSVVITFYTSGAAAAPTADTDVNFLVIN